MQAAQRKALVHRFIERFEELPERLQDRAADRGAHHGKQSVRESGRVFADGFTQRRFDCGRKSGAQGFFAALLAAQMDGFRQHRAHVTRALVQILDALAQPRKILLLGSENQVAELFE